jgi:pSer/pThr/pTyr-binding forkhead associated (FHA) protein
MQDGRTRTLKRGEAVGHARSFLDDHRVTLVVMNGPAAGSEFVIEREKTVIGRGLGVDLPFRDPAMSSEHVAIEMLEDRCRARDLASTNGMRVNASPVLLADLKHGDTIELGEHRFGVILEETERDPDTYVLPES